MGASSDVEEVLLPVVSGDIGRRLRRTQWTGLIMGALLGTLLLIFAAGRFSIFQRAQGTLDLYLILAGVVYTYGVGVAAWVYFGRLAGKQVRSFRLSTAGLTSELQSGDRVTLSWGDRSTRLTVTDWRPSNPEAGVTIAWKARGSLLRAKVSRADAARLEGRAREKGWGVRTENKIQGARSWSVRSLQLEVGRSDP